MPGLTTLRMTWSPEASRAQWLCAIDAEARGKVPARSQLVARDVTHRFEVVADPLLHLEALIENLIEIRESLRGAGEGE